MAEISQLDNKPWIPRPIPNWLMAELTRRKKDFGVDFKSNIPKSNWDLNGNWNEYKGPMAPWVRVCSNGNGQSKFLKPFKSGNTVVNKQNGGFVLYGGQGFKDTFGISDNKTIMGYDVYGNPHYVPIDGAGINYTINTGGDNRPVQPFLPTPGITTVEATIQKELIRNITIRWHCYGFAQLEYLTPYFLTPGISTIVEFGWNHFNEDSLLDLKKEAQREYKVLGTDNKTEVSYVYEEISGGIVTNRLTQLSLKELFKDGTPLYDSNMRISRGMYDVTFGIITNFEFSTNDGIKWDCITTIGSKHRNFSGVSLRNSNTQEDVGNSKATNQTMTFPQFVDIRLKKIKNCITNGKNFFDRLDDTEEELKINVDKSEFYGGNPENRVFFGRSSANPIDSTDPKSLSFVGTPREEDWDKKDSPSVWVTMGFLIELFNFFLTRPSGLTDKLSDSFQFYKMNNSKTIIGAHTNLLSTDGEICLIPNAQAPKYNLGLLGVAKSLASDSKNSFMAQSGNKNSLSFCNGGRQKDEFYKRGTGTITSSYKNYADAAVYKTFRTLIEYDSTTSHQVDGVIRDDLDRIINRFRYNTNPKVSDAKPSNKGDHSFPQYKSISNPKISAEGKYGYLEDIFVNTTFVSKTLNESKTSGEFYEKLLQGLNESVNGFWDLKVVEDNGNLQIIDQKMFSIQEMKNDVGIYQFDLSSGTNVIKNLSFTSTISNVQANQVIAASSNNQGVGENSTSQPLNFTSGDRLFDSKNGKSLSILNSSGVKQLQTFGPQPVNSYIMSFSIPESTTSSQVNAPTNYGINQFNFSSDQNQYNIKTTSQELNIVNLTLPDKALLTAILNDENYVDNTNVYGGQQPNFTLEFTLQGIAGFKTFQVISFKNFPRPYSDQDVLFQIVDVTHVITNSNWETRIKAGIRPIRDYDKLKLKYTEDGVNSYYSVLSSQAS